MERRSAIVFFKDEIAGTLAETVNGGTRFTYAPSQKEKIACCFPITSREHEWRQGLHPFFQHLGPEGWLREKQARVAHIVEEDDFGLLLRYGADCIGAVSLQPAEDAAPDAEITEATANPGRTVSGVQRKLLVTKDSPRGPFHPAAAQGPAPYIAKFNSERIDTLVRNEALSLRWTAAVLGAKEVNTFQTAHISDVNEIALVVTRFDRNRKGEKLRQEDCAQILCKPKGQNYAGKYDAAYEDVADIIKTYSTRPEIDLARFFRRLIAFTLIGNCDAHLKNFSLLETPTGLRLSPAYDVVNTVIYDGFDQTLALSINGKKIQHAAADNALFHAFGHQIGLSRRTIDQTFTALKRQALKAAPIIEQSDTNDPQSFRPRFAEIVSNACLRILGE
jgi:serine/threonine-protein kinase HipA|tara:strand:+ start:167580 stop:168752 length:1173 start_codon:yes stop_codon:yes gene_type:complete